VLTSQNAVTVASMCDTYVACSAIYCFILSNIALRALRMYVRYSASILHYVCYIWLETAPNSRMLSQPVFIFGSNSPYCNHFGKQQKGFSAEPISTKLRI